MKKIYLYTVLIVAVGIMSGCQKADESILFTVNGENITEKAAVEQLLENNNVRADLIQMTIDQVALKEYGQKVSEKEIDEVYQQTEDSYGDMFDEILAMNQLSKEKLREQIKAQLAVNELIKSEVEITDAQRKELWKDYQPKVKAYVLQFDTKAAAEKAKGELANSDKWEAMSGQYPVAQTILSNDGTVKVDSETQEIPAAVKEKLFHMKEDTVSDIIESQILTDTGNQTKYFLAKLVKGAEKGKEMKKYQDDLDEVIYAQKLEDDVFRSEAIAKALKQAKVKADNEEIKDLFDQYHLENQGNFWSFFTKWFKK